MGGIYNNYRMIEEVKERAVERGSGITEFESYDRVAKLSGVQVWKNTPPGLVIIMVKF